MAALLPCNGSRHPAVSIVTLLSTPSPCCRLSHSLAVSLIALQSVSSPCCQPPRLAVGRLEICLTALQSAPSPCSRPRQLAVGPITLELLILSLITRHKRVPSSRSHNAQIGPSLIHISLFTLPRTSANRLCLFKGCCSIIGN